MLTLPYMYEPEVLRNAIDHYRQALVQAGHDPATREVLGKFHIYVGSEREAVAEAGPYLHNYWTVADAQHPGAPRRDGSRPPSRSRGATSSREIRSAASTSSDAGATRWGSPLSLEPLFRWHAAGHGAAEHPSLRRRGDAGFGG